MSKPSVNTNPVANQYTGPNERIVEFTDRDTGLGGLIALRSVDGRLVVEVYRTDEGVIVRAGDTRTRYAIKWKGTVDPYTGVGDGSLEAYKRYIDGAVERGQKREDYAIVQREVTRIEGPWTEVQS